MDVVIVLISHLIKLLISHQGVPDPGVHKAKVWTWSQWLCFAFSSKLAAAGRKIRFILTTVRCSQELSSGGGSPCRRDGQTACPCHEK